MKTFQVKSWSDYELLDCGAGQKLERFGEIVTIRPEIHATGSPKLDIVEWVNQAHCRFTEKSNGKGKWEVFKPMPEFWHVRYPMGDRHLKFVLRQTPFKHLGIFPEQSVNWDFIYNRLSGTSNSRVLNLFAYTGGASLAARMTGAAVTHVDSIKSTLTWARENMEASGLADIRWMAEDALKFARREVRRGNRYTGIIMDPPTYGVGPKGQRWRIEDQLEDLLEAAFALLEEDGFLILNTYSGIDPDWLGDIISGFSRGREIETGYLSLKATSGNSFNTGILTRVQ